MYNLRFNRDQCGLTLMEVMVAMAIFSGVIGVTAQALMSFYVSIHIQEQRMEGIATCRSVMDGLREKRYEFKDNFPDGLLGWVAEQNDNSWEPYLASNEDHMELAGQEIVVTCSDLAGNAADTGDNPVVVQVTTTWLDRKGHPLSASIASMLTDE